jgi:hypothetical protein
MFACSAETLAPVNPGVTPVRITDGRFTCKKDIHTPGHCLPDGVVYAILVKGKIVSVAYAYQRGRDIVPNIGVATSKRYRGRGPVGGLRAVWKGPDHLNWGEGIA